MEVMCEEALAPDPEQVHSHRTLTREKDGLTTWVALVLAAIPFIEVLITSSQYRQHQGWNINIWIWGASNSTSRCSMGASEHIVDKLCNFRSIPQRPRFSSQSYLYLVILRVTVWRAAPLMCNSFILKHTPGAAARLFGERKRRFVLCHRVLSLDDTQL